MCTRFYYYHHRQLAVVFIARSSSLWHTDSLVCFLDGNGDLQNIKQGYIHTHEYGDQGCRRGITKPRILVD